MNLACLPRSRVNYLATLKALDVENRRDWQANHEGMGWTYCNQAVEAAIRALDCHIPIGLLANAQQEWLDSMDGAVQDWEPCDADRAVSQAELGFPTVATLREPLHGHIAMVVPSDSPGMHVWQAGRHNYESAPIARGFGTANLPHVRFFTHP